MSSRVDSWSRACVTTRCRLSEVVGGGVAWLGDINIRVPTQHILPFPHFPSHREFLHQAIMSHDPIIKNRPSRNVLIDTILKSVESCSSCAISVGLIVTTCERCCPCPVPECGRYFLDKPNIRRHIRSQPDDTHKHFDLKSWVPRFTQTRDRLEDVITKIYVAVESCDACAETVCSFLDQFYTRAECPVDDCPSTFYDTTNLRRHMKIMAHKGDDYHKDHLARLSSTTCIVCGEERKSRISKTKHEQWCMFPSNFGPDQAQADEFRFSTKQRNPGMRVKLVSGCFEKILSLHANIFMLLQTPPISWNVMSVRLDVIPLLGGGISCGIELSFVMPSLVCM